jgi:hypothetical protein
VPAEEFAVGRICATRVRLEDDYLHRVAGAVRRVLAREDTGRVF